MEQYSIYTTADREQIVETMSLLLERLLEPHYLKFRNYMLVGIGLLAIGALLLVIDATFAVVFAIIGLIVILYAYMKKVYIREAGVIMYPILAIPYGDLSVSVLVDVLAKSGDDVSFKISRVDKIKHKIEEYLNIVENLQSFYVNPDVPMKISDLLKISVESGVETSLEEETVRRLSDFAHTLSERPYDEFSFKLFLSSEDLTLYPAELPIESSVLGVHVFEKIEKYADKINALIESLKIQYRDLMTLVLNKLEGFTESIKHYYGEIEGKVVKLESLIKYLEERPKVRLCPNCISIHRGRVLRSAYLPVLQIGGFDEREGLFKYVCPECGNIYHEHVYFATVLKTPIRRYQSEILQFKTWNRIYLSEINEINRYISEARRHKVEVFSQALRRIDDLNEQFKTRVLPIYLKLGEVYGEIRANLTLTGWAQKDNIGLPSFCYGLTGVNVDLSLIEEVNKIMGGERTHLQQITDQLKMYSSLRTSILFDELFVNMLVEALEKMDKPEDAQKVRSAYRERLHDELEALVSSGESNIQA